MTGSPQHVPVLMYHSVSSEATDAFREFVVPPRLFAEHLAALHSLGYSTTTITALAQMRAQGTPLPERLVAITVDDAFADFADAALPALASHGMVATLYVPTGYVGGRSAWLADEAEDHRSLLSWSQLREISGHGVECGAHSHSHPQMDLLDRRAMTREIGLSKALLEDHLGRAVTSFAYPFGYANATVRRLVEQLGFSNACAVRDLVSTPADDAYAVPRLTVTPDVMAADLTSMLQSARTARQELTSSARAVASRGLRRAGLKKRGTHPSRHDWWAPTSA